MSDILLYHAPKGWRAERLGQIFRERNTKTNDHDFPPLSVTKAGVVPQIDGVAKSDDSENRKLVRKGDFVINSRSDRRGSAGLADRDGSVSLINTVLVPVRIHPRFAHYLLRSYAFQEEFYRSDHGIVADLWTTRWAEMKNIRVAVPDETTQIAIADFLDGMVPRIDALIERKQALVARLHEKQSAALHHATENDGPMTKLGHHVDILPGYAFRSDEFSSSPEDIRLLRGINVSPGFIRWDDTVYWPRIKIGGLERFILNAGDIVFGMDRPWINSGIRVAELSEADSPALLLQRVCKIVPRTTLNKNYLKRLLASPQFLAYFEPILTGVSVPHVSADQIAQFRFPMCEVQEQEVRSSECRTILDHTTALTNANLKSIALLEERRATLITLVTTGQTPPSNARSKRRAHIVQVGVAA